jgi:UPF0716 protein FxsA
MRFVVLAIVLAFPLFDLYVTTRFARWSGVPLWVWLVVPALGGMFLLRNERLEFRARTVAALHGEQAGLRGLLDSGRKVLAGMLFIIPGLLTDAIALMLLALPINQRGIFDPLPAGVGRASALRRESLDVD